MQTKTFFATRKILLIAENGSLKMTIKKDRITGLMNIFRERDYLLSYHHLFI